MHKTCKKCGVSYSATTEWFYKYPRGRYGVMAVCRKCRNGWDEWPRKPSSPDTKICTACKLELPKASFGPHKMGVDGLRPTCRECHKTSNAEWRSSNKDYNRVWRKKNSTVYKKWFDDNAQYRKAYFVEYHASEKGRAAAVKYVLRNRARLTARENMRRAKKLSATPSWANLAAINAIYAEAARMNKDHPEGGPWHVDHIIPLNGKNVTGLHVETNLRIVSRKENLSKRNKVIETLIYK